MHYLRILTNSKKYNLQKRERSVRSQKSQIKKKFKNGGITPDQYKAKLIELESQLQQIKEERKNL